MSASVSKISCKVAVRGKGEATLALYRHLAPLTVNAILRVLPIESRVSVQSAMVCSFTTIKVGVEKPRRAFERGDVAFLPSGSLLCVFLKPAQSERPLNPVGKVEAGMELLDGVGAGDVARIELVPAQQSEERV